MDALLAGLVFGIVVVAGVGLWALRWGAAAQALLARKREELEAWRGTAPRRSR